MVSEKSIIEISQVKQKKQDEILDKIIKDVLNGRINGNINKIIEERIRETLGIVILADSEESGYEEVVLNEDVFYNVLSLTVEGRVEELGNIMISERWIEIYDVTYVEIFNITNIEIRKKGIDILLSEITDGLLDEILFGLDFDCEVFRSRLKTIINKLQNENEAFYETHDEESDENED